MAEAGIAESKILLQPVGADLDIFGSGASDLGKQPHSVISTRNLNELYRVGDLLEAVSIVRDKLPELSVTLAGDGPLRASLEHDTHGLGIESATSFTGRLDQPELAAKLAVSQVYVSTSPVEGTSISLLEAMACGCLPVVADIPANRDWINHGVNGLLFPPGNANALATCLQQAFEESRLAEAAAACNPRAVASRGSFAAHVDLTASLYQELVE